MKLGAHVNGTALRDLAAGFMGSAEFTAEFGASPTNEEFVDRLYINALHRGPDAGGKAASVDALVHGMSRLDLLLAFSESAEHVATGNIHM